LFHSYFSISFVNFIYIDYYSTEYI
jgi:hypothetical protein